MTLTIESQMDGDHCIVGEKISDTEKKKKNVVIWLELRSNMLTFFSLKHETKPFSI